MKITASTLVKDVKIGDTVILSGEDHIVSQIRETSKRRYVTLIQTTGKFIGSEFPDRGKGFDSKFIG